MAAPSVQEILPPILPPSLDSTSEPPPLFDGTTRLHINYHCPCAHRVWIVRNHKLPSLEHNEKVIGESLDLVKYVDSNFEGPSLLPNDPTKRNFIEELLSYTDTFITTVYSSFKGDIVKEAGAAFDYLETALLKFYDGPFFLGQFNLELNKLDAYKVTKGDPKIVVQIARTHFLGRT